VSTADINCEYDRLTTVPGIRIYPVYSPMSNICKDRDQAV